MKDNFIHVCFVIDESGSMGSSISDVIEGFKSVIKEQQENTSGTCAISLYKFNDNVQEVYKGKDVNEVKPLTPGKIFVWNNFTSSIKSFEETEEDYDAATMYAPAGCTAMFDGIGTAVFNTGQWLAAMPEQDRPSKNLIVIMTDGEENASHEYSAAKVKAMIKEQEEKYNWSFLYMGTDITTTAYADSIGVSNQMYTTRSDYKDNYYAINAATTAFRCCADASLASDELTKSLSFSVKNSNDLYMQKTGFDTSKLKIK